MFYFCFPESVLAVTVLLDLGTADDFLRHSLVPQKTWKVAVLVVFLHLIGYPIEFSFQLSVIQFFKRIGVEAVIQRCSVKKVFLEISQNSQENGKGVSL